MNRPARPIAVLFGLVCLVLSLPMAAADPAETKVRLLSAALQARDAGDTATARQNLQELLKLKLNPDDETVKRLLTSLDRLPQKKVTVSGGAPAPAGPDPAALAAADQLARAEEERLARVLDAAGTAVKEARALAKQNQFSAALDALDRAGETELRGVKLSRSNLINRF